MTHTEYALLGVHIVGRCYVDGIYLVACGHRRERGEDVGYVVLGGKLLATLARARTYGREAETFIFACSGDDPVGDKVGAYDTETYFFHYCDI